jgi:plasmid stabilization system protein ParE
VRRVRWTGPARSDLRRIDAWLAAEADDETALAILRAIRDRADFLCAFPKGGPELESGQLRKLRVRGTPYIILYRLAANGALEVLRIRHAKEDWKPR